MAYRRVAKGKEVSGFEGYADETAPQGAQEDARGTAVDRASMDGCDEALKPFPLQK